jgi:hypothetical protein
VKPKPVFRLWHFATLRGVATIRSLSERSGHQRAACKTGFMSTPSTTLADFEEGGFPNHFFCDSWVVGFLEGPTMVSRTSWEDELGRWLKPFLDRLGHKARRRMCPLYVSGLIGPGESQEHYPDGEASCALAHAINCITSLPPEILGCSGSGRPLFAGLPTWLSSGDTARSGTLAYSKMAGVGPRGSVGIFFSIFAACRHVSNST